MNWGEFLTAAGISIATVAGGIWYLLGKGTDHFFERRIKQYENELQDIGDKTKFDYQRKLRDFNLFTTKKHEWYINLYEALLYADGHVSHIARPFKARYSLRWYNSDDVKEYLQELTLPRGRTEELLALWVENPTQATQEIHNCVTLKEELDADNSVLKLQENYWKAQLYLSPELIDQFNKYIEKIQHLSIICKKEHMSVLSGAERGKLREEIDVFTKDTEALFNTIVDKMRSELSVGYYEKAPQKDVT